MLTMKMTKRYYIWIIRRIFRMKPVVSLFLAVLLLAACTASQPTPPPIGGDGGGAAATKPVKH
jgi:hypothetical protein